MISWLRSSIPAPGNRFSDNNCCQLNSSIGCWRCCPLPYSPTSHQDQGKDVANKRNQPETFQLNSWRFTLLHPKFLHEHDDFFRWIRTFVWGAKIICHQTTCIDQGFEQCIVDTWDQLVITTIFYKYEKSVKVLSNKVHLVSLLARAHCQGFPLWHRFFNPKNIKAATISPSRRQPRRSNWSIQKQRLCCGGVQLQVSLELCGGESRHADGIVVLCFGYIRRGIISTEKATSAHHTTIACNARLLLGTTPVFSLLKQLHKKDVFSYLFSEIHQFSSLRRSMNRCLWWLTSFPGQTFLALGYLRVVDISDNGRMLEEKGGVTRWRCEDTVSFFPISKFIVRKSCGKPDHDHDRCFFDVFCNYFCYLLSVRLRESTKNLWRFQSHLRSSQSGNILISLLSPPVTAGCFHLAAETANFLEMKTPSSIQKCPVII